MLSDATAASIACRKGLMQLVLQDQSLAIFFDSRNTQKKASLDTIRFDCQIIFHVWTADLKQMIRYEKWTTFKTEYYNRRLKLVAESSFEDCERHAAQRFTRSPIAFSLSKSNLLVLNVSMFQPSLSCLCFQHLDKIQRFT